MNCCCEKIYLMCDVPVCDGQALILPFTAPDDGPYTLDLDFLDHSLQTTKDFITGAAIAFPKTKLNEGYTYTGRVLDGDHKPVSFIVEGVEYDCFEFTTKRQNLTIIT